MTTHLKIETVSDDNQRSLFRSQRIKAAGKSAVTPFRALDPSKFRTDIALNRNAFGFNEIYKEINPTRLAMLQKDPSEHDRFARELANLSRRGQSNDFGVCFVRFIPKGAGPFPNSKEIEFLTDISHSYSDLTPIPMFGAKIDDSNFSKYIAFVQACLASIEELNQKPIMGSLPNLPRELYPKLLEFYSKEDINAFYFDFDGQTPDHLKMRPILRHLHNNKLLEKSLLYGINAKPGRVLKNTNVIPSKDFIAYGFGLDILGESHVGSKLPKVFFEKMKKAIGSQQENKKRIFMKSDYGYYKTSTRTEVESIFPTDTQITLDRILGDDQRTWQKLFNMEQQAIETGTIRKRLGELDPNESVLDYIKEKTQIQKELKHLQNGPRSISKE